jgi:alpha-tubulin suppressor-like RCC1 family protein
MYSQQGCAPYISNSQVQFFVTLYTPTAYIHAIAAGAYHTCVVVTGGQLLCWGLNNHGQLGIGNTAYQEMPAAVSLGSGALAVREYKYTLCMCYL